MDCSRCGGALAGDAKVCGACGEPVRTVWVNAASIRSADGRLPAALNAPDLYAGFWRRVAAFALDGLILAVISIVVGLIAGIVLGFAMVASGRVAPDSSIETWGRIVGLLVPWLYFAKFESSASQATPGKRALGLEVTDEHGGQIGFWHASGRYVGRLISVLTLCVGYMMAGWTQRKQTLHDMLASCCVVRRQGLDRVARQVPLRAGVRGHAMPRWAIAVIAASGSLLLVVPVLAAMAIPAYQVYVVRVQVGEGMQLAQGVKARTAEFYANTGKFPESNAEASVASPPEISGEYVSGVHVGMTKARDGVVLVNFSNEAPQHASEVLAGNYLAFIAQPRGDRSLAWECVSNLEQAYLGRTCKHVDDDG